MGAGPAAGNGNSKETSTPFGTSKGTAKKTRFGFTKTSNTFKNYNNDNNDNNDGGNDNNNTITQVTKTAPTEAEVSQATTADADTEANRLLKVKKKGRSMTMMSGSQGVTRKSSDYSLGKKSLLGIV